MQLAMTELADGLPRIPSTDVAHEIVKYEPRRIAWAKLVEDKPWSGESAVKVVHVGTISGKPAWANGFMLEVAEVPERLKALKKYREVAVDTEGKRRVFDSLVPEITPQHVAVRPLATIVGEKEGRPQFHRADVTYLAGEREITIQTKYIDYFLGRYPDAQFLMHLSTMPLVVRVKGKSIGVIMPIQTSTEIMLQVRDFLRIKVPVEPPPRPPVEPVREAAVQEVEAKYSAVQLKDMARAAGIDYVGLSKRELSRSLLKAGAVK